MDAARHRFTVLAQQITAALRAKMMHALDAIGPAEGRGRAIVPGLVLVFRRRHGGEGASGARQWAEVVVTRFAVGLRPAQLETRQGGVPVLRPQAQHGVAVRTRGGCRALLAPSLLRDVDVL